ncbi:MAG TPA: TetR/AcrR family transcriptional regulator [candidate division Zixibacteria bacterium]|nr:TetR/AcrR family transcriptional regulator [candidate division Zixibacteria bacterium]
MDLCDMARKLTSGERRTQIIDEATRLFSNYGFEKMTVNMLASACGITEAALYRYFPSKEKIYDEVLESLKDRIDISSLRLKIGETDDIEVILVGIAKHIFGSYIKHKELARLLLFSSLERHSLANRVYSTVRMPYVQLLIERLEELIAKKKIRKVNPIMTARCFVGMVTDCSVGLNLWKRIQGTTFRPDEMISNNIPIFAQGLKYKEDKH